MDKTILTKLPFWSSLSDDVKERVEQRAYVRSYGKGMIINNCNNECLGMILVLSGEIRTYLLSDEGREVTLFRLYVNDLCVLSASCVISQITFETQMTAQQNTEALIIPVDVIASLKEKISTFAAICMNWQQSASQMLCGQCSRFCSRD